MNTFNDSFAFSSINVGDNVEDVDECSPDFVEPKAKKQKTYDGYDKLEDRLGGILCCAVCLDLPKYAVYQCTNGHLMCVTCFTHLLADARLRDEPAVCPNCRTLISRDLCLRNLAVEKAISELPAICQHCTKNFPRLQLELHENELCTDRQTFCRFSRIGCPWVGTYKERSSHEKVCQQPNKRATEVINTVVAIDQCQEQEILLKQLCDLLSFEKLALNDLQLRPYRTDEFVHKLFYETPRFTAFGYQWVVKAQVNDNQMDPTQSCERTLTYQLLLKNPINSQIYVRYMILKGPIGDMQINPQLYSYQFSDCFTDSTSKQLALEDSGECNRLLATKIINFRLIMFQVTE